MDVQNINEFAICIILTIFCKISTLCTAWPPHVVSMNSTLAQAKQAEAALYNENMLNDVIDNYEYCWICLRI